MEEKKNRKNIPIKWSQLSYAGKERVPQGIQPHAGSWPTFFLKKDKEGHFLYPNGKIIEFDIIQPDNINFEDELLQVKEILAHVTKKQIDKAKYWGEGPATKQWTPIIDRLIDTYGQLSPVDDPVRAARILAAVQAGINDAFVVCWHYKYIWDVARPNQLDQNLRTIICTPAFPSYPSGHATMSGCAEVILSYFFPKEAHKLRRIAEENAISRVYGGVHYPIDGEQGLRLGRQIGKIVVSILRKQYDNNQTSMDPYISKYLDVDIIPTDYTKQLLPFPRKGKCDSLIIPTNKD